MLSYASALKIPTPEALLIIDAIDNRDAIIDALLNRIQTKYAGLSTENEKLKLELENFRAKYSFVKQEPTIHFETTVAPPIMDIINKDDKGNKHLVLTEATQKGYELCQQFSNYNCVIGKYDEKVTDDRHTNIFEIIRKLAEEQGFRIFLTSSGLSYPSVSQNIRKIYEPPLTEEELAMIIDTTYEIWYDYNIPGKKRKFLSALSEIVTDFVSDMVYVEKVLERLDRVVNALNHDDNFLEMVFNSLNLPKNEEGSIGIVFKGGNIYKLYASILSCHLDKKIFENYLADVENFFKKSDCDFSLVLIATTKEKPSKHRFIHLEKDEQTMNLVSTIQYMILNQYRNEFLSDSSSFEHLSMCGKNDIIMSAKINEIAKTMMETIVTTRLEYEQQLFKLLLNNISFSSECNYSSYLLPKFIDDIISVNHNQLSIENSTLFGILKNNNKLRDCFNNDSKYNIYANITDWYRFFLSISFRDTSFLPQNKKFKDFDFPDTLLKEIQNISTNKGDWRDVKTFYNFQQITNIVIGDYSYPILSNAKIENNDTIYQKIISNKNISDYSKTVTTRIEAKAKLHSNRNDFFIKFTPVPVQNIEFIPTNIRQKLSKGETITDILETRAIPFEDKGKKFITPFYIGINKDISATIPKFKDNIEKENWEQQLKRLSKYGSSGYGNTNIRENNYKYIYQNVTNEMEEQKQEQEQKPSMMLDFGLSRLMLSTVIICKSFDNNYFALSIPAEFIDLSYTYKRDHKSLIYENYDNFVQFNGSLTPSEIDKLMNSYEKLIEYVSSSKYLNLLIVESEKNIAQMKQQRMIEAVKTQDPNILSDVHILKQLKIEISNISLEPVFTSKINLDPTNMLNIIKYYTKYGRITQYPLSQIICNNVYIPKLSTFILDLYTILFSDSKYPWENTKYSKRLQRYIFFVFIERLKNANIQDILVLLDEMGIDVNEFKEKSFPEIMEIIKNNVATTNYESYNSLNRTQTYFKLRNTIIKDNNSVSRSKSLESRSKEKSKEKSKEECIESACAIDRFMFGYHLLDFLYLYHYNSCDQIRQQYIVTIPSNDENKENKDSTYILVSLSEEEIKDNETVLSILNSEKVKASYKEDRKRYQELSLTSNDSTIKELTKYIKLVEYIREKLLITIVNYLYDYIMNTNYKINVINTDTLTNLLNMYEGDIDKILTTN
jgi:hypothetical protein